MNHKHLVVISFLLLFALSLFACNGSSGPAEEETIQERLDQGKSLLAEGDAESALASFQEILLTLDPDNPQAMWGSALALLQEITAGLGDRLAPYLEEIADPGAPPSAPPAVRPLAVSLNPLLESLIDDIGLSTLDEILSLLARVKQQPDFYMQIEHCPIQINLEPFFSHRIDIGGEFDLGEVYFFSALLRSFKSIASALMAVNLDISQSGLPQLGFLFSPVVSGGEPESLPDRELVLSCLAGLFGTSPGLFTLEPALGRDRLDESADLMMAAFADLGNFLAILPDEEDDQSDDVIAFEKEGLRSYLVFQFRDSAGDPSAVLLEHRDELTRSLGEVFESLSAGGGTPVEFIDDMVPLVATILYGIIQTELLDLALELARPWMEDLFGTGVAALLPDMVETLRGWIGSEGTVEGALEAVLPNVLALDLGRFFRNPSDLFLRSLLPEIVTISDTEYRFLVEYECTDLAPDEFWCEDTELISSAAHFSGTGYFIEDDGIEGRLPYLAFQDPSLDGTILLNLNPLDPDQFPDAFSAPDGYALNFVVHTLGNNLLSLIQ